VVKFTDITGSGKELKLVEKSEDAAKVVKSYAKFMEAHMQIHYEQYVRSAKTPNPTSTFTKFNLLDLLYYHVYGDYRMVYDKPNDTAKLEYITADPKETGDFDPLVSAKQINSNDGLLNRKTVPGVVGVYNADIPSPSKPTYTVEQIAWMDDEINKGSSGYRLMLPSIGTQIVTTFAYSNINKLFRKFVHKMMENLNSFLDARADEGELNMDSTPLSEGSDDYVLTYLLKVLKTDEDFKNLPDVGAKTQFDEVEEIIKEALKEDTVDSAIQVFTSHYIKDYGPKFIKDEEVYLKKLDSLNLTVRTEMELIVPAMDMEVDAFTVIGIVEPEKKGTPYKIQLAYGDKYGAQMVDGATNLIEFNQEHFRKSEESKSKATITKSKKQYIRAPEAHQLVFYRIILDQLAGLQSYLFSIYGDNMHFGYLSDGINISNKENNIKAQFPMFKHPIKDNHTNKKKIKKSDGFIPNLISLRSLYAVISLTSQRSISFDKDIFDQFYKGDMVKKEVEWLANALSDWGKVIVSKEEPSDPLAMVALKPVAVVNDPTGKIEQTGEADRKVSFYRIEVPMLKQVIQEYNTLYNAFTISNAYAVVEGDPNEAALAKALWASIEKRTSALFDLPGIKPHEFFDSLFDSVDKAASGGAVISADPYPPAWAGTRTLSKIIEDPSYVEELPTADDYKKYLKEYLGHLKSKYIGQWKIPSAILTSYDNFVVAYNHDSTILRESFSKRLEGDAKKSALKGTAIIFQAYSQVISIMRAEMEIPLGLREEFIAEGMEKELKEIKDQLNRRKYGDKGIAAYTSEYPRPKP